MPDWAICEATPEDLRKQKRACWAPQCKSRAWLEDGDGWHWCLYHWYRSMKWGGNKWFYFKTTRIKL